MKHIIFCSLVLLVLSFSGFSQVDTTDLKTVELLSPIDAQGKRDPIAARQSCFSFITGSRNCVNTDLFYGGIRQGNDWDWFWARGVGERNKIKKIGKKQWTDKLNIPVVTPYPQLEVGEKRHIFFDSSGEDGEDGKPGENGRSGLNADDSTTSDRRSFDNQIPTDKHQVKSKTKTNYHPLEEAVEGNMYVMRVVDDKNDFYVLFRVDELERGTRCKISWKKIAAPKNN